MYTKAALISALAGLAIAAPAHVATYRPTADPNTFTIIASHSLSPVQGAGVSANGGSFYLNKGSGTYCPSPPVDCSYCTYLHFLKGFGNPFTLLVRNQEREGNTPANSPQQTAQPQPSSATPPPPKPSSWAPSSLAANASSSALTALSRLHSSSPRRSSRRRIHLSIRVHASDLRR